MDESLDPALFKIGDKLKAVIPRCRGLYDFTFKTYILTSKHFSLMKSSQKIMYPSGDPMYKARPYTTDLGDIKIYINSRNLVFRCKIKDLYTMPLDDRLVVRADVHLIDRGTSIQEVDIESLFDFQQTTKSFKEIPPELNAARINLGGTLPLKLEDDEINQYFVDTIEKKNSSYLYPIQILDYRDGVYHVDVFDSCNRSIMEHIRKKFRDKLKLYELSTNKPASIENFSVSSFFEPVISRQQQHLQLNDRNYQHSRNHHHHQRKASYTQGALQYFQKKTRDIPRGNGGSYLRKRFFKVKVLCWSDPHSLYVIPDDNDYLARHREFIKDLEEIEKKTKKVPNRKNKFKKGDRCLFRNDVDPSLGPWLRGVIISAPKNFSDGFLTSKESERINGYHEQSLESEEGVECNNRFFDPTKLIYLVESIDYGFQCSRTSQDLLIVQDDRVFQKCPWALKCKLFGVEPYDNTNLATTSFTEKCLDMIDSWMRERILDNSRFAFFHVLFRTDILPLSNIWKVDNKPVDITLFHRFEPPCRLANCIGPRVRRTYYHCLNSYIIDCGLASETNYETGKKSRVDLDHYLVNLLVRHDRI